MVNVSGSLMFPPVGPFDSVSSRQDRTSVPSVNSPDRYTEHTVVVYRVPFVSKPVPSGRHDRSFVFFIRKFTGYAKLCRSDSDSQVVYGRRQDIDDDCQPV